MAGQKILLIEDEKMLSKLYGDVLAQKGYHVSVAASIDEALEVLARGQIGRAHV
jgi:DNA-binding response OmpR family regulator